MVITLKEKISLDRKYAESVCVVLSSTLVTPHPSSPMSLKDTTLAYRMVLLWEERDGDSGRGRDGKGDGGAGRDWDWG